MKNVLFAWIGANDLNSAKNDGAEGLGPIGQAVTKRLFDDVVLLSNYPRSTTSPYIDWLSGKTAGTIDLRQADLKGNPTDYRAIYENAKEQVQQYLNKVKSPAQLTFHLSPGTPAMATVWVVLANSLFDARLIQSSPQRGVEDVELPFDIAVDYLPKLLKRNERKVARLFSQDLTPGGFEEIIYQSPAMISLIGKARMVAPHPVPVLIEGESGTGKEALAKAIHTTSLRKGRFVAINCGAIPADLFESELFGYKKGAFTSATTDKSGYIEEASGGTLFLDEIGEMPLRIQVKLLRLLQEESYFRVGDSVERKADIRIISATNRNLMQEVASGTFREDLFHRLAVAIVKVPALREREGDIGLLVDHLLAAANNKLATSNTGKQRQLSAAARAILLKHSWPGNVRELQNTLLRAVIWSADEMIDGESMQDALLPTLPKASSENPILDRPLDDQFDLDSLIAEVARHYIGRAIEQTGGNKKRAAEKLNFKSYQRLDNWLKKYQA
ncbi:MAG: sigma-54 dependent transcriptional regulator [Anaerolineaceae bacterium]|nr:sigma-54 dependent transcriptional regulator [Anaerolineaceae bacterium]